MDALEALRTRRSCRQFLPREVARDLLTELVDAGRLAASARNVQPWEFVVVTDEATRRRIADLADTGRFIADAPACIAVVCKDTKYFLEDGSAATQNLLVAARALGLGSCWVAGDKKPYAPAVARLLAVPDEYRLVALVAVGYPVAEISGPDKRPLADVIHWGKF
jgi:nitroreductase